MQLLDDQRHDSVGKTRAPAPKYKTDDTRGIVRLFRAGYEIEVLGARLLLGAAVLNVTLARLFAARAAHGTAQELGLVLHHVEALAAARRLLLARRGSGLAGLYDGLRRLIRGCGLAGRGRLTRFFAALVALAAVVAIVRPLVAPVAETGIVVAVVLLAPVLAPVIATIVPSVVSPVIPALVATVLTSLLVAAVFVALLGLWLRLLAGVAREGRNGGLIAHARIGRVDIAVLARLANVGARHIPMAMAVAIRCIATALLHLLLAVGDNHAVVVFGVLEVVLGEDGIAGGLRIAGEGDVLGGDVGRRTPDFDVGAVRLEAARERVLPFAVVMMLAAVATAAAAATPTAMLLTLPHRLPFFPRKVRA